MGKDYKEKIKEVETLVAVGQTKMDQLLTLQRDAASAVQKHRVEIEDFMKQFQYSPVNAETQKIILQALHFALGSAIVTQELNRIEEMKSCLEEMKALAPKPE